MADVGVNAGLYTSWRHWRECQVKDGVASHDIILLFSYRVTFVVVTVYICKKIILFTKLTPCTVMRKMC